MKRINSATEMSNSTASRQAAVLEESLHRRLTSYALAAGAAGVGVLASATPAEADIIYHPSNIQLKDFVGSIDLNGDGKVDFDLILTSNTQLVRGSIRIPFWLRAYGLGNNRVLGSFLASELPAGALIGTAKQTFSRYPFVFRGTAYRGPYPPPSGGYSHYACSAIPVEAFTTPEYFIGLELRSGSQVNFGWARLTQVSACSGNPLTWPNLAGTLSGYAYETVSGEPIRAGQTAETPEPATLGLLALGSLGLGLWRRKQGVANRS